MKEKADFIFQTGVNSLKLVLNFSKTNKNGYIISLHIVLLV